MSRSGRSERTRNSAMTTVPRQSRANIAAMPGLDAVRGRGVQGIGHPYPVIGTDDSSSSDDDRSADQDAQHAAGNTARDGQRDDIPQSCIVKINGVECCASGDRLIPDLLFGARVMLRDESTNILLLPNGIDGSVRVVNGRQYTTVVLRGGTADLIAAGMLEDDRRLVPRAWVLETVSAAYRAGSAQFYHTVPTLKKHIEEMKAIEKIDAEHSLGTLPAAVCEADYNAFGQAVDSYRNAAAASLESTGTAWAGIKRKHLTGFTVFLRENAGAGLAVCRAAYRNLTVAEQKQFCDKADAENAARGFVFDDAPASERSSSRASKPPVPQRAGARRARSTAGGLAELRHRAQPAAVSAPINRFGALSAANQLSQSTFNGTQIGVETSFSQQIY